MSDALRPAARLRVLPAMFILSRELKRGTDTRQSTAACQRHASRVEQGRLRLPRNSAMLVLWCAGGAGRSPAAVHAAAEGA